MFPKILTSVKYRVKLGYVGYNKNETKNIKIVVKLYKTRLLAETNTNRYYHLTLL